MSKVNDLPTEVPLTTGSFQVDMVGQVSKKRFLGDFGCRIPNLKDQALIDKHYAFLNGNLPEHLNSGTRKLHQMIAYLRFTLTDYPSFWLKSDLGYELMDLNVIEDIYNKVLEFENVWIKQMWGDDAEILKEEVIEDGKDPEKESSAAG